MLMDQQCYKIPLQRGKVSRVLPTDLTMISSVYKLDTNETVLFTLATYSDLSDSILPHIWMNERLDMTGQNEECEKDAGTWADNKLCSTYCLCSVSHLSLECGIIKWNVLIIQSHYTSLAKCTPLHFLERFNGARRGTNSFDVQENIWI